MKTYKTLRIFLLGFITWLVPFVASFGFYDRSGNLNVTYGLFKCVMVVIFSCTGMWALQYHFNHVKRNFAREGLFTGMAWLLVNYVLDFIILVPMTKMSPGQYFITIGLGYLQLPVVCTVVGMIVQRKVELNSLSDKY